jgi:transposase
MNKKHNIKPKQVDYFVVPKPLWKGIKPLLPKASKRGRPRVHDRWALNAIWYVLWTGWQWKALKREWFGISSSTAHARPQEWQKLGIFAALMTEMVKFYHKRRRIGWKWQAINAKNCPAPLGAEQMAPRFSQHLKNLVVATIWSRLRQSIKL